MLHWFFTKRLNLFFIALVIILWWLGLYWYFQYYKAPTSVVEPIDTAPVFASESQKREKERAIRVEKERENDASLTDETKKERALLLSKKGDYLALNNEHHDALDIYLRVIDLDSGDNYKRKAAAIAFSARNFAESTKWYLETLPDLSIKEKEELLMSMRYTGNKDFKNLLSKLELPANIKKAYEVSWTCETLFLDCESAIKQYSFDYPPINVLKKALEDFKNLKNTDSNYKEALLIGAFYQNKDYSTVIRLGSRLLSQVPDYKPILKVVGFSSYLTNQHERAENALKKYKTLDSKDPEVDFILGLIYFAREDYKLSNLYFNNAVKGWYQPKSIVERKLAYNYGILWLNDNMFEVLGYLVNGKDATELDITNSLYLVLNEKRVELAEKWIKIWAARFPNSPDFLSLRGWHLRLTNNSEIGLTILQNVLKKHPNNLIGLIQAGIIYTDKWQYALAEPLLEKAKVIDAQWVWAETIEQYLKKLPMEIKSTEEERDKL